MALFEEENPELAECFEAEENSYLKDPVKGLGLVRTLLRRKERKESRFVAGHDIRDQITALLAGLELDEELEFYHRISRLDLRMRDQERVSLLDGKVVLGVGGRFSAGKSCFINSIADAELPEEQRETTSIATYVVRGETKRNVALTTGGESIELDDEAVQALTHQFYATYHIGFSRVIENLAICSPTFRYSNIAILDTPGYNKADTGKMKEATDAENARKQLRSVDYLIWLVDIENGELKADDERFINSLNISTPVLIIFNKAGTVLPEKAETIVSNTAQRLEEDGRNVFAVIAYDSFEKRTVIGGEKLKEFLDLVNQDSQRALSLARQMDDLQSDICAGIDRQVLAADTRRRAAEASMSTARDARNLGALLAEFISCGNQHHVLLNAKQGIQGAMRQLNVRRGDAEYGQQ